MAAVGTNCCTADLSSAFPALLSCSPSKEGLLGDQTSLFQLQYLPAPAGEQGSAAEPGSNQIPSYTSVPRQGTRAELHRKLCHHPRANPGRVQTGGAASPARDGCWDLWMLRSAATAHLQTSAQGHRASLQRGRGQGTARTAVPAQSSAPAHLWATSLQERRESSDRATPPCWQLGRKFSFQPRSSSPPSSLAPLRFGQAAFAAILSLGSAQLPQEPFHAVTEISSVLL